MSMLRTCTLLLLFLMAVAPASGVAQVGQKTAFVIGASHDFGREIDPMKESLDDRGYTVHAHVDVKDPRGGSEALAAMQAAMANARPGDQILIAMECHGEHYGVGASLDHLCCLNDACNQQIWTRDLRDLAKQAHGKGVKLVVMDESCSGGATVKMLDGIPDVCAIASTTDQMPALTGQPSLSKYLGDSSVKNFEDMSRQGTLEILKLLAGRPYQRMYTSGCYAKFMDFRTSYMKVIGTNREDIWDDTPLAPYLSGKAAPKKGRSTNRAIVDNCRAGEEFNVMALNEFQDLNSFIYRGGDAKVFSKVLNDYDDWKIDYPYGTFTNIQVAGLIRERIEFLQKAQKDEFEAVRVLNLEVERYEREGGNAGRMTVISGLVDQIRKIQHQVTLERPKLSALLNVVEEQTCAKEKTPCSQIQI